MGKLRAGLSEKGYTLIEAMFGAAILAFIAVALLPALFSLSDAMKIETFRSLCMTIVRAKLQDYLNGVPGETDFSASYIPTGFEYTKYRFQQRRRIDATDCFIPSAGPQLASPGYRERVRSNEIVADNAAPDPLTNENRETLRGFRLFVLLRHYNPRVASGQPTRECPDQNYQFLRLGDAIEVTVTGMIRVQPAINESGRGGALWGRLDDAGGGTLPNPRLTCSLTQLVYPPRIPFRYYLGLDGRLRNLQTATTFKRLSATANIPGVDANAAEAHFRDIWYPNGAIMPNIRSVSVSPDNKWVYVLKPGAIFRYGECADEAVTVGGTTFNGIPDCPTTPENSWSVDTNIENITVDFKTLVNGSTGGDDMIYGLFNTGVSGASGDAASGNSIRRFDPNSGTEWTALGTETFSLAAFRPRMKGIYLAPSYPTTTTPSLFFIDNTCYGGTAGTNLTHCVSAFNSGDSNMRMDIRELPVQVEDVSY